MLAAQVQYWAIHNLRSGSNWTANAKITLREKFLDWPSLFSNGECGHEHNPQTKLMSQLTKPIS